jgi:hypothetical protein
MLGGLQVHLSAECLHLISRMIVPDPQSRMALEQIMVHPWFLQDLPAGTLGMNTAYLNHPRDLTVSYSTN